MLALASSGKRIAALALVGCLAGLAMCSCARLFALLPEGLGDLVGCVFGLLLCAHFWLFDETRSVWRALGFVGASTLAYQAATREGMHVSALWPVKLSLLGLYPYEINILLIGGFIGAGILFLGLCFYFPVRQTAPALLFKFGIFVVAGSLLGVIGYALGPYLGAVIWHLLHFLHLGEPSQARQSQPSDDTSSFYSLYVVWQTGIAILIAVLFPFRASRAGASPYSAGHLRPRLGWWLRDSLRAAGSSQRTADSPAFGILFRHLPWPARYGSQATWNTWVRCFRDGVSEFRVGQIQSPELPGDECVDHRGKLYPKDLQIRK